jgi:proteasome beta subunit
MRDDLKTGTTTVGLIIKDAVVLAADMRASMGHLAYDEESQKLYKITDNIAVTNAGAVGDSLTIIRFIKSQAKLFEIEREKKVSVKAVATLLSNVLNANRYYPFIVQLIIGGIKEKPELYEVTPFGGLLERKKFAVSGSGTELALSFLDQNYREGLSESEGIDLAVKAVKAAKKRDIYSGGISVTVMVIDRNGIREFRKDTVKGFN